MAEGRRSKNGRIKWTEEMNGDLMDCKQRAQRLVSSENPPRKPDGKKMGYMQLMKELWEDKGYAELQLSCQNLRDQAARIEKTLGDVQEVIRRNVGREGFDQESERNEAPSEGSEGSFIQSSEIIYTEVAKTQQSDLHTELDERPQEVSRCLTTNAQVNELLELARPIFNAIVVFPGDFSNRTVDTRTKERPSRADIDCINNACNVLLSSNSTGSPQDDPFQHLWLVNCVLYAVVVALLLSKGWKKRQVKKTKSADKDKEALEEKVKEIRRKLSIAQAESDRIKKNGKITKRGRRNRKLLLQECKAISVAELVNFMEKEKSKLRKLKRVFARKRKNEEARKLNTLFQDDSRRVYANFKDIITDQGDEERPKFQPRQEKREGEVFENIDQATGYWKSLWESEGTGNLSTDWLEEIKQAIADRVPEASDEECTIDCETVKKIISKKRNWSAPGPDKIVNYWWKKAESLHEGVANSFREIGRGDYDIPLWFTEGKSSLLPKPGIFTSENHRPITCLNNLYKWFTSCLLEPTDAHLNKHGLMQGDQRGAKEGCAGTTDNLLIDRMVGQDSQRGKRNVSMAWVDVRKAYDSVDHRWLVEMFSVHRFPPWLGRIIGKLSNSWNTKISVRTAQGTETSDAIMFKRGLPQGDALCPRLFTLCINPIAWMLSATEGYTISKPIGETITHLLYIDDLKIYAASEEKLTRVMRSVKAAMGDIGLHWNERKCAVAHVKRGILATDHGGGRVGEAEVIESLKEGSHYKFLGVMENIRHDDGLALEIASKTYMQRLSVIWSSPLSDVNKVLATNQFAMPVLSYLMSTQCWPITELQRLDRESRKVIVENGGKHPLGLSALVYLPRKLGGRGLKSVEREYKQTKVKAAARLYTNRDPTMEIVRRFETRAEEKGRRSLVKDAKKYAAELGYSLSLIYPTPTMIDNQSSEDEVPAKKIGAVLKNAGIERDRSKIRSSEWQGQLITQRWDDEEVGAESFSCMSEWKTAPTNIVAGFCELYEQMLPTKVYHKSKTGLNTGSDTLCRMCGKAAETQAHVLAGCNTLAQSKYLVRHNAALKILFYEILKDLSLVSSVPPWYSNDQPKPLYENKRGKAFWDVPVYAEHAVVRNNRIDAQVFNKEEKKIYLLEMSCPWVTNRESKYAEKTLKYAALRYELRRQYPDYDVQQHNIIIDVLGSCSSNVRESIKVLMGDRQKAEAVLRRMQKAVVTSSIHIARTFKILSGN